MTGGAARASGIVNHLAVVVSTIGPYRPVLIWRFISPLERPRRRGSTAETNKSGNEVRICFRLKTPTSEPILPPMGDAPQMRPRLFDERTYW